MRSKRRVATLVPLGMVTALSASALEVAHAVDRSAARSLALERDLRSVRSRVERAPRASSLDLEDLQRRLHEQRIEDPTDPRLQELQIELRQLRAQADRAAGRPGVAPVLPRISPLSVREPVEKPRYLGGAHTRPGVQPARPYSGQRLVVLQRNVAEIERRLERGETAAAARLLEAAQADIASLRRIFDSAGAADPNLIALEDRIEALKQRLAGD